MYRRSTEDINTVLVRVVVYNNIATAAVFISSIFLPPTSAPQALKIDIYFCV